MIKEIQPGFICFSSAITEKGEELEKNPSVSVIMRVERVDVDEKTLLGLKRIQQKAAAEVDALLGWTGGELLLARSKGGEPEPPAGPHLRFQNGRVADGTEAGEPTRPEPVVKLGPGVSFRQENTHIHGQYAEPQESANADALLTLKDLCGYCRALAKNSGAVPPEREWATDAAALEFAISILSELREIKEVQLLYLLKWKIGGRRGGGGTLRAVWRSYRGWIANVPGLHGQVQPGGGAGNGTGIAGHCPGFEDNRQHRQEHKRINGSHSADRG